MEIISPSHATPPHSPTGMRGRRIGVVVKSPSPTSFATITFAGNTLFGCTAEMISNAVRNNRSCTVQISNHLTTPLNNPKFYCHDGSLYYPLPPIIQPGSREVCVFSRGSRPGGGGVIGLITYQIGNTQKKLAIMFSVAYNQLQYRNHFGTALILEEDEEVDEEHEVAALFERMYQDPSFYRGDEATHCPASDGVPMWTCDGSYQIRATMSDRGKAIIKLNISTVS